MGKDTWNYARYRAILTMKAKDMNKTGIEAVMREMEMASNGEYTFSNFKDLARTGAKSPKEELIVFIENYLQVNHGWLTEETDILYLQVENVHTLSDFNKNILYNIYVNILNYIDCKDVESEEEYQKLMRSIKVCKIAIPDSIYRPIIEFCEKKLYPIVYKTSDIYYEALKYISNDIEDDIEDEAIYKTITVLEYDNEMRDDIENEIMITTGQWYMYLADIKMHFDQFADKVIKPHLT